MLSLHSWWLNLDLVREQFVLGNFHSFFGTDFSFFLAILFLLLSWFINLIDIFNIRIVFRWLHTDISWAIEPTLKTSGLPRHHYIEVTFIQLFCLQICLEHLEWCEWWMHPPLLSPSLGMNQCSMGALPSWDTTLSANNLVGSQLRIMALHFWSEQQFLCFRFLGTSCKTIRAEAFWNFRRT